MKKLAVFLMLFGIGLFVTGCSDGPDAEEQTPVNNDEQKEMHNDTTTEDDGGGGTALNDGGGGGAANGSRDLDTAPPDPTGASTGK